MRFLKRMSEEVKDGTDVEEVEETAEELGRTEGTKIRQLGEEGGMEDGASAKAEHHV